MCLKLVRAIVVAVVISSVEVQSFAQVSRKFDVHVFVSLWLYVLFQCFSNLFRLGIPEDIHDGFGQPLRV